MHSAQEVIRPERSILSQSNRLRRRATTCPIYVASHGTSSPHRMRRIWISSSRCATRLLAKYVPFGPGSQHLHTGASTTLPLWKALMRRSALHSNRFFSRLNIASTSSSRYRWRHLMKPLFVPSCEGSATSTSQPSAWLSNRYDAYPSAYLLEVRHEQQGLQRPVSV